MVDFRYHALSLVAVFLALGIGIVLGVTVGDSLVSDADRNLRDSLREDVTEAREQVREQQDLGASRDEVIEETAEVVAEGRLRGTRTAFVALGELPGAVDDSVEDAPRARQPARQRRLGRRIGRTIELDRRAGPANAVVLYRHPAEEAEDEDAARALELREAFEDGLLDGLRDNVVAVEALDTDPSQVGWYDERVVPSVDNVDTAAGRLALVLLLEEAALAEITGEPPEGSFGYKATADRALPDLSD